MTKEKQRRKDCQWLTIYYTGLDIIKDMNTTTEATDADVKSSKLRCFK
jgi:hypothetical protein